MPFSPVFRNVGGSFNPFSEMTGYFMARIPFGIVAEWDGSYFKSGGNRISVPKSVMEDLPPKPCFGIINNIDNDRQFQFHIFDLPIKIDFGSRQDVLYDTWRGSMSYHLKLILADKVESPEWISSKIEAFSGIIKEFWFFKPGSDFNDEILVFSLEENRGKEGQL